MKNLFVLIILVLCSYGCFAQKGDCHYYYNKTKIDISINEKFIVVYSNHLLVDTLIEKGYIKDVSRSFGVDGNNIKVFEINSIVDYESITSSMRKNNNVKSVEPIVGDSIMCSNRFYVKLLQASDTTLLKQLADSLNCNVVEALPYCSNWYEIESLSGSTTTVITKANIFYESGMFDKVDYGFIFRYYLNCVSDPMYSNQWGVNANSAYQINACDAWSITTGNSNVKVAIIDGGIKENHEDFSSNQFVCSFDAQSITTPALQDGSHATHVAGIIFAKHNSTGIAGISPDVSGINISASFAITDTISKVLARGIFYAVENNADIICNSWGDRGHYHLCAPMHSELLEDALDNAIANGRNGKGCVVVFASGNQAPTMDYPGDYRPEILTVGSISSLGEKAPDSAYGDLLDVVAPGVNILSTYCYYEWDIVETYYALSGTSMAAPHVAGVAALILSVNPNLTGQQVRDIIETTAQKIRNVDTDPLYGLYSYAVSSDHPNGSWNNQVGYGLVDAYAAVQAAVNYNTDLYVRDYATDDGTEPSVTDNMWNSPDIWLENLYYNPIQNPTGGTPCYVCVRVHNRNNIASSGTETLLLNWAKAGVDLQWNHNWTGTNYFNCGGTYVAKGGVITSGETIPAIPANSSTVVRVLWTPPMPSNYSNCTEFNTDPWHFCLAARVHDGNTIPNENSTNYGMGAFTLNSNNVAWKNISIMNSSENSAVVSVSKPANMTSSLSIEYVEHPNTYGETLSQFARVNMYFDTNLTSAWNLGGSHFSGVKVNGTGEFMVINDTAVLSDIMLDTGLVCTMLTEVNFFSNKTPKDNVFEFDIMLYSGTTFIGAEHYVAIKDKKGGIKAIARDDTKSFAGDEVTFYAETNNSNVSYKWYGQNGEPLGTGAELTVYPRQSQSYILEVKSDDEGFIDMDTVCVQICRGAIVVLSPNPTSDILNIEYRLEENISSATVSISNGLGIVMRTIPVSNTQNRNTVQTNIQGLTSGRYSVELKLPNGEILDAKSIIVQ